MGGGCPKPRPSSHRAANVAGVLESSSSFAQRHKLIFYRPKNFSIRPQTLIYGLKKVFEVLKWSEMNFALSKSTQNWFFVDFTFPPMQYGGRNKSFKFLKNFFSKFFGVLKRYEMERASQNWLFVDLKVYSDTVSTIKDRTMSEKLWVFICVVLFKDKRIYWLSDWSDVLLVREKV